jgi:hypothetical protein
VYTCTKVCVSAMQLLNARALGVYTTLHYTIQLYTDTAQHCTLHRITILQYTTLYNTSTVTTPATAYHRTHWCRAWSRSFDGWHDRWHDRWHWLWLCACCTLHCSAIVYHCVASAAVCAAPLSSSRDLCWVRVALIFCLCQCKYQCEQ